MQTLGFARLGRMALDLIYPPKCVICGAAGVFLCARCEEELPAAHGERCDRCWLPLGASGCYACFQHPPVLHHLRSAYRFEAGARRLVHAFKFGGQSSLAPDIGRLLARTLEQHELDADVIVPVPLTGSRRRVRGYNQAQLAAEALSKNAGVPMVEALRRSGHGQTQATSSTAEDRRRNVTGVFDLARGQDVAGARVLLVDDVATTGATLDACAAVLFHAGAASVSGLTFARED